MKSTLLPLLDGADSADIFRATATSEPAPAELPPLHPRNVERMFTALREMVRPEAPGFGRPLTRGEIFRGQLESHWKSAKVVSFDIFDTAIVRKCQAPRDVFLFLADYAPFQGRGTAEHFAVLRQQAEGVARRRVLDTTGSAEATLLEIHTDLAALGGFDSALVPQMVAAEELAELSLCVVHPFLQQVYRRAHASGRQVWFVSDSYHNATFLRRLLAACGYNNAADRVVSSCDERCSKGSGQLLPRLLQASDLAPQEFVHIGDNMQSDCVLPNRNGISGVWHPLAGAPEGVAPNASKESSLAAGLASWGTRTFEPARPFWWRFGFGVAGPLLVGFAWWLHQQMRNDGITRAYFLLRDGDILKRVYDELLAGHPDAVPSALLESSRRAFMLPALGPSAPSLTSQLFVSENPRPVGEFLTRLRIRIDDLHAAFVQAGFRDCNEVITANDLARLSKLFSNPRVVERIGARSAEERDLLVRYLRQEGVVGHTNRVALVDIGWNGTIQKSLDHATKAARVNANVVGYYLGTFAPSARDSLSPMRGYLCERGLPHSRFEGLANFRQLAEFICTSARGSLLHFAAQGNRIVPIVAEPDHNEQQMECIGELHEGVLDYATLMREEGAALGVSDMSPDSAAREYFRLIGRPTAEEAMTIGAMRHGDGMASNTSRAFAQFNGEKMTPDSVLADYAGCYWQQGLLNQHTPHALVLRSLLWLHEG